MAPCAQGRASVSLAISVVIPCRNEHATLALCLDALHGQSFPKDRYELIVVDGGSTDGSRDVARARGIRVLRDPGRGPGAARNVGLAAARAPIVAFTDADCVPARDWLTSFAEAYAEHPEAGGIAGGMRMPRDTLLGRLEDNDAITFYRGFITSNVAYRRDVLQAVGGFDETLVCCEDYDLAWRIMDAGYTVRHDARPVVTHRTPDVAGSLATYLRKQFWYARHDAPAHARAICRTLRPAVDAPGSRNAVTGMLRTTLDVTLAGAIVVGAATRSPALAAAGLVGAGALASWRTVRAARGAAAPFDEVPEIAAVNTLKALTRGIGSAVGVLELARPSRWHYLRSGGGTTLVPRARAQPASPAAPLAQGAR